MTLTQAKKLAKELFAKIHNLPVHLATNSRIKKVFPQLKISSCDSWLDLVDFLLNVEGEMSHYPQTGFEVQVANVEGKVYNFKFTYFHTIEDCKQELRTYKIGRKNAFSERLLIEAVYTRMSQAQFNVEIELFEEDMENGW
jgi:hypothetical protein